MGSKSWWSGSSEKDTYVACYHSHKPMKLVPKDGPMVGSVLFISGGSCHNPIIKDADVYIGLDANMRRGLAWPWKGGVEVEFPITDMNAPTDAETFKALITWTCTQLQEGKKVHVGCIGGHGRTGTFLAALTAELTGEKDAIQYVRKNYCEKAVESVSQIKFLMKHFGVNDATPTKTYTQSGGSKSKHYPLKGGGDLFTNGPDDYSYGGASADNPLPDYGDKVVPFEYGKSGKHSKGKDNVIQPAESPKNIWGRKV